MPTPIPVVLVTGGSRGLGRGVALQAAQLGYSVVINYRANQDAAAVTVDMCGLRRAGDSQRFLALKADIASPAERKLLLDRVLGELGRLDALVNNAGMAPRERADITAMTEESFEEVLRVNLQGPFFLTQSVARYWLERKPDPLLPGGFKVVFVTSISADTASLNRGEYCMSKAGLAMASQLWAVRLAEHGVQVYELRPGIMETDMTSGVRQKYDELLAQGLVPQRRWGTAEDVGRAVGSILAGQLPFSTGTVIHVDGGFHIRRL